MKSTVPIEDVAIWFKHVPQSELRERLSRLHEGEVIHLQADGIVGRWMRMRQGKNSNPTEAIKPDGSMKRIWNEWFTTRKGELIEIEEVRLADDYLSESELLFPEWLSPEDEEAFRDL